MIDAPTDISLSLRDVCFHYGNTKALDNINLDIKKNQVTTLIGPNGCGKSTLLRTLNRMYLLYPTQNFSGTILLNNQNILDQDLNELRSKIGMVFQKPTPFPISIYNNVAFGVKLHENLKSKPLAERVEWALQHAGLWDEVKDKLHQSGLGLSGGQQQRLCIARAIAIKPEVLLLDEPTSSLDPLSTKKIEALITQFKSEYTILMVTHNLQQAARISDYTAYLYLGKIVEYDRSDIIFHHAKEQATRDYVEGKFG